MIKLCKACGNTFEVRHSRDIKQRKFCSYPCSNFENITPQERFLKKVNKTESCWLWTGDRLSTGYGRYAHKRAHRVAYELFIGPIPNGLIICHHCDNPPCVNPEHLYAGTNKQNCADRTARSNVHYRLGESHQNSKLTANTVREIRRLSKTGVKGVELGKMFGVCDSSIHQIVNRLVWKWLCD